MRLRSLWIGASAALAFVIFFGWQTEAAQAPPVSPTNQAAHQLAVTPSDSTTLTPTLGLYNGNATACNIAMVLAQDSASVTWLNVPSGVILPVVAIKVMATGTTCSNIIALYGQ